jgi:hypothetical protein
MQSENGHSLTVQSELKRKSNYTGERLKSLRPETYREVVRLLAEPREHVSIREICRRCHVTDDTIKAVERREAVPIAARKQELMLQAARIAKLAADRVEDQIDEAPLPQAVVTFGVMTDKIVALSNEIPQLRPMQPIQPSMRLWERLNQLAAMLERNAQARLALPNSDAVSDSGAETGLTTSEQTRQKES